ncbi:MAG: DUF1232 domain-containing protein [Planctomycetaceae bacterium]|nr:DUF1232 domain-containing protein [Planctomycetaceae bacterium]
MVTLALPDSPTKQFATQLIGWAIALACGLYVISPIDVIPEAFLGPIGMLDDVGALLLGIGGAIAAKRAGKDSKEALQQVTRTLSARHARGPRSRIEHHSNPK